MTSAYAADDRLGVDNVQNAVPGMTGSLDIVFSDISATHYLVDDANENITVTKLLTDDDTSAPDPVIGVDVKLQRTFTAGKWSTLCLPFEVSEAQKATVFGTDAKIGDFAGYSLDGGNIVVNFTEPTSMAANHPYIIKVANDVVNPTFENVNIESGTPMNNLGTDDSDENIKAMIGVYNETTLAANWLYIKNSEFKYSTGTSKLKAYHAYFRFCDFTDVMHARSIIFFEDTPTGIRFIESKDAAHQQSTDGWYDLQGRKLPARPKAKGLYINNGKKEVIK